ncbi:MAG: hypothetical protein K2M31_07925 [Muribaculaceae bacterium]|nr:hypothetical protein [Muribaculaceae bacterium]
MKKLLLYLMTLLVFGAIPVDAFAGPSSTKKPLYVEVPAGWTDVHFWWWRDNTDNKWDPTSDGYSYNSENGKTTPNLNSTDAKANLGATKVTGSDNKTYYKIMLPDDTDGFKIGNKTEFKNFDWNCVYNYSNDGWSKGASVGTIFASVDPGNDFNCGPNQYVIGIPGTYNGFKPDTTMKYIIVDNLESGNVTIENIPIGDGTFKLVISSQGGSTFTWYGLNSNISKDNWTELKQNESNVSINNSQSGETFNIELNKHSHWVYVTSNGGSVNPGTNYSNIEVYYKSAHGGWNNDKKAGNLDDEGKITFDLIIGQGEGFNFWFNNADHKCFENTANPYGTKGNYEFSVNINEPLTCNYYSSNDKVSFVNVRNYNNTLDKDKVYTVTIDYPNKTVKVDGIVSGNVDPGTDYSNIKVYWNSKYNNWTYRPAISLNADGNVTFPIQIGSNNNEGGFHLYFDVNGTKKAPAINNGINNIKIDLDNLKTFDSMNNCDNKGGYYQINNFSDASDASTVFYLTVDYPNKTFLITRKAVSLDPVEGVSTMSVLNANSNWQLNSVKASKDADGNFITTHKGYEIRGYDGLGLGQKNFCIATTIDGVRTYWGLEGSNNPITRGQTYTLVQLSESQAKQSMVMSGGLVQSRYDVTYNWLTHEMKVTLNDQWSSNEDLMYLWREFPDNGVPAPESMTDEMRSEEWLNENPHVIVLGKNGSGLYEAEFKADVDHDLPRGTKISVFGRTGVLYNMQASGSYSLQDNSWLNIYRHPMVVGKSEPAIVNTNQMENENFWILVNPNVNGNVVITFRKKNVAPAPFKLINESDNSEFTFEYNEGLDAYQLTTPLENETKYHILDSEGNKWNYVANGNYWVKNDVTSAELQKNKQDGIFIKTTNLSTGGNQARLLLNWNNGEPTLRISVVTAGSGEGNVRVYFVDRAHWGGVSCYNYTDAALTATMEQVPASDRNGDFPGVGMSLVEDDGYLLDAITRNEGDDIYYIDLKVEQYPDGTYDRPKVIFALGAGTQTANLYLVDGGIYTNASSDGEYPATEYLPRMHYNYSVDSQDPDRVVSVYPNEFFSTDYNVIYIDVPEFTQKVKNNQDVSVEVVWDRNNNGQRDFIATGIPGKHHLSYIKIGNKELVRVQFANDVVPDGEIIDLRIWEGNDKTTDITDNTHHCTTKPSTADYDWKDGKYAQYDGHEYDGNHFYCVGSHCSLNFTGVEFKDGNVYRRYSYTDNDGTLQAQDPVLTIKDLVSPDHFYIVNRGTSDDAKKAFETAISEGILTEATIDGISDSVYEVKPDDSMGQKLGYTIPEVSKNAVFNMIAQFGDDYIYYSNSNDIAMLIGNQYKFSSKIPENQKVYTISDKNPVNAISYDVTIEWNESFVSIDANRPSADFSLVDEDMQDIENGFYIVRTHSDACDVATGHKHYTPLYFSHKAGYENTAEYNKKDKIKVSVLRNASYDKYFASQGTRGTMNSQAEIVGEHDNGYTGWFEYVDQQLGTDKAVSLVAVRSHTANKFSVRISQNSTITDGQYQFAPDALVIPVVAVASPEGIGMTFNNKSVVSTAQPNSNQTYSLELDYGTHIDWNGAQFRDGKIQIQADEAEYRLQNPNGYETVLEYYWRYTPSHYSAPRKVKTIMRATNNSALTASSYYGEPLAEGMKKYSINSTPAVTKNGTSNIQMQIKQNGITSPIYNFEVTNNGTNIPTEVEEILGVEEGEAVYYNLNGVRVDAEHLEPGIYVKVTGTKSEKVYVK